MQRLKYDTELGLEFTRLSQQYRTFYWMAAWAGARSDQFRYLARHPHKIQQLIIGLHFYQTHPDFIETFLDHPHVAYIQQPSGTYHPKAYLFYNADNDWELLIGSANFTWEAFNRNTEVMVLQTSADPNAEETLTDFMVLMETCRAEATRFDAAGLQRYRTTWKNMQRKLESISGTYDGTPSRTIPIHQVPVATMNWQTFIAGVINDHIHGLNNRLQVIDTCRRLFKRVTHFHELELHERKFIAGLPNHLGVEANGDWEYFGSMKGSGTFHQLINQNSTGISQALDAIPLGEQITEAHYDQFVALFSEAFPGNNLATATRLLAMKRPDVFYCLTSQNQQKFCTAFGITRSYLTYATYWSQVIERIYDSDWWQRPTPQNGQERQVRSARAAFLDSLYYAPPPNGHR